MPARSGRLRVALVSTPFVRVPPVGYGGTERIVAELACSLQRLGHRVTLFSTGDSHLEGVENRFLFPRPLWPPEPLAEWNHAVFTTESLRRDGVDVVHAHMPSMVPLGRYLDAPVLHTVHHDPQAQVSSLYRLSHDRFVCISARQAELMEHHFLRPPVVVHHGISPADFPAGRGDGGYALFIGRLDECKGPHVAVQAARRAGIPLIIAGKAHEGDYHAKVLAPEVARGGARMVGELAGARKIEALCRAAVLLFPIRWEEPFGLVLVEAMMAGTPVVALRRGAVPEIVDEGVTGYTTEDPDELAPLMRQAMRLDRGRVRARAQLRFSADRMAADYVAAYRDELPRADSGHVAAPLQLLPEL